MTNHRAALEAQIAALEAQLASEDAQNEAAPATPTTAATTASEPASAATPSPSVSPAAPLAPQPASAPPSQSPTSAAAKAGRSPEQLLAKRSTPLVGARPAPVFMRGATQSAQVSRTPGVVVRARPAPQAAAPAVAAPAAAAPAVAPSAPLANRQRPIVRPTAAPKQLPRVGRAPTIGGTPRPAQPRTGPGSAYMRPRSK